MNYFKSIMLTAFAIVALTACDTDDLKDDINDLKGRVESLEAQVNLLNDNMTAIKRLIEGGQSITNVVENDGTYTITLFDNSTITLTQGVKGSAKIPVITVVDGYWVVEGVQLKDMNGNPVRAEGATGEAGITPKFQISDENNYWQISYDGGTTWKDVEGKDGKPVSAVSTEGGSSSDTFFQSAGVDENQEFFNITMKDGKSYSIPIVMDVICEIKEPTNGMRAGYWEVNYGKTVTTTVKVKGDNIIINAPSGWIATIGDIDTSNNEALLSITAPTREQVTTRTRATADNSEEITIQANTNASWAVAKIKVKAIIGSYYELYKAGETFTINGIEINKTKFPANDNTHITANGTEIKAEGIYFIDKGITVNYNNTGNVQDLIIIGDNSQEFSTVNLKQYIRLTQSNGEGNFLCLNIALESDFSGTYMFNINANVKIMNVAFENCHLNLAKSSLTYINGNSENIANRCIANFSIEKSTCKIPAAIGQQNIINYNSNQNYDNVIFKNNIFYCPNGKVDRLALFNGGNATITNLIIENNTFVNMESNATGYASFKTLNHATINKNIFWTNTAGTVDAKILVKAPTAISSNENIVYKTMKHNWSLYPNVPESVEDLKIIDSNPFDGGTFDLAKGVFIPSAEYAEYGASIN